MQIHSFISFIYFTHDQSHPEEPEIAKINWELQWLFPPSSQMTGQRVQLVWSKCVGTVLPQCSFTKRCHLLSGWTTLSVFDNWLVTNPEFRTPVPDQQMEAALCQAVQLLFCFLQENLDFQSVLSLLRYSWKTKFNTKVQLSDCWQNWIKTLKVTNTLWLHEIKNRELSFTYLVQHSV